MNFDKDYIELCKCKEVQELRPEMQPLDYGFDNWSVGGEVWLVKSNFYNGSYLFNFNKIINEITREKKHIVWLPTGDQLDEEIIKVCKERNGYYQFDFTDNPYANEYYKNYVALVDTTKPRQNIEIKDKDNPLICKIKLLAQLLKEQEWKQRLKR